MSRTDLRSFSRLQRRPDDGSISSQGEDFSDTLHYSTETLLRKSPEFFWGSPIHIPGFAFDTDRNTFDSARSMADRAGASPNIFPGGPEDSVILDHHICDQYINGKYWFLPQVLSIRRGLQTEQTLTATHDTAAAWVGIGSAIVHAWNQKAITSSTMGVLSAFLYLGNVSVLHITIPALFSLESFISSHSVNVATHGLPAFNFSGYDLSNETDRNNAWTDTINCARGSLYFLPLVLGSPNTLGVHGGTIYDVLEPNSGVGDVTVDATGFDITCYNVPDVASEWSSDDGGWWLAVEGSFIGVLEATQPGAISSINLLGTNSTGVVVTTPAVDADGNPIVVETATTSTTTGVELANVTFLYSTIPIVDSGGNTGSWVNLYPPLDGFTSSIQLLRCSQSPVSQTAVVDAQSRQLITLTPSIVKNTSTWQSAHVSALNSNTNPAETLQTPEIRLVDAWQAFYNSIPASQFPRAVFYNSVYNSTPSYLSVADLFLSQQLNLWPVHSDLPRQLTLHDLENALSMVVASMFWTISNTPPIPWYIDAEIETVTIMASTNITYTPEIPTTSCPLLLLQGNTMVTEDLTRTRLDLSVIAVSAGLVVSITLTLLSLPKADKDIPIDGTGILHVIWLYRNHPELNTLLEQVEHPTDKNLREAGMFRIRLMGGGLHRRKSCEAF
ncbi:hypothetical protein C8R45DRAFT_1223984 [Mycena sanguinolenta]|nr:hypothetical protein C8R45DRAFT_1223984 [Mycena sanguinolenta]